MLWDLLPAVEVAERAMESRSEPYHAFHGEHQTAKDSGRAKQMSTSNTEQGSSTLHSTLQNLWLSA